MGRGGRSAGGYPVFITFIDLRKKMVEQTKKDDPQSIVYHIDEIVRINKLKPDIKSLKSIHDAKKSFGNSKVVKSK